MEASNTVTTSIEMAVNHTDRVEQPATHPARCRQSEESLPHRRLLEESARAAVFLYIRFHRILLAHRERSAAPERLQKGVVDKGVRPCIDSDHCLALCGNQKALGDWNPDKAALYERHRLPGMAGRSGCRQNQLPAGV